MAQSFSVYASGWKTVKAWWVYVSGAWRPVKNAWVYQSGAWRQFYTAITISGITSPLVTTNGAASFAISPESADAQYTISGGTGPYTQTLSKLSGDTHIIVTNAGPNDPTSNQVSVSTNAGRGISGVFQLTVTDSLGASNSVDVTVTLN